MPSNNPANTHKMAFAEQEYNNLEWVGTEVSIPSTQTIGATAVEVAPAKRRKALYIKNTSSGGQTISLMFSNNDTAVANTGYVLGVNDVLVESNSEGFVCWNGRIMGISSAAGGTISIVERV